MASTLHEMTASTDPSASARPSVKGQKDFVWLPGSRERPRNLSRVRTDMSCSEVQVVAVLASSNVALTCCTVETFGIASKYRMILDPGS